MIVVTRTRSPERLKAEVDRLVEAWTRDGGRVVAHASPVEIEYVYDSAEGKCP